MSRRKAILSNIATNGEKRYQDTSVSNYEMNNGNIGEDNATLKAKSAQRRRMTAPNTAGEDLFLSLASDAGTSSNDMDNVTLRGRRNSTTAARSSIASSQYPPSTPTTPRAYTSPLRPLSSSHETKYDSKPLSQSALSLQSRYSTHRNSPSDQLTNNRFGYSSFQDSGINGRTSITRPGQRRSSLRNEVDPNLYLQDEVRSGTQGSRVTESALARHQAANGTKRLSQIMSVADGGESVVSGTVVSTVWDELDTLKSRIRQLEMSGNRTKYPPEVTSNDSADRPRTGTTYTSYNSQSNARSPTQLTPGQIHPLLQSALAKAELTVSSEVFRALDASASEALQLAKLSRETEAPDYMSTAASMANGLSNTERRVRRKADNLCRSLTELCIALCEGDSRVPSNVPSPLDQRKTFLNPPIHDIPPDPQPQISHPTINPPEQRRNILERAKDRFSSRSSPSNRLATTNNHPAPRHSNSGTVDSTNNTTNISMSHPRRPSIPIANSSRSGNSSQDDADPDLDTDPTIQAPISISLPSRSATTNHSGSPERSKNPLSTTAYRGPSRAMSEIHQNRASASQSHTRTHSPRALRLSRDYTSKHPLPEGPLGTALARPSLPSAATSRTSVGAGLSSPTRTAIPSSPRGGDRLKDSETERGHRRRNSTTNATIAASPSVPHSQQQQQQVPTSANLADRLDAQRQKRALAAANGAASTGLRTPLVNGSSGGGARSVV